MQQVVPIWKKKNRTLSSAIEYISNSITKLLLASIENDIPVDKEYRFNLPEFESLAGKYDAVIHIGMPKTGSSVLQSFLLDNVTTLKQLGFYYPKHDRDANNISGGHTDFGNCFQKKDLTAAKQIFESYLATAKKQNLTLLLSAESLYWDQNELKKTLEGKNYKIIAFFRDPLDSLFSHYNQMVKRKFFTQPFEQFCRSVVVSNGGYITGKFFDCWQEKNYKDLIVLGYDLTVFEQIRIEKLFLKILGIRENSLNDFYYTEKKINKSYAPLALELKRQLNFVLDNNEVHYDINHAIDLFLQNYSDQSVDISHDFLRKQISKELYITLKNKFKDTNQHLLEHILTPINPDFLIHDRNFDNFENKPKRYNAQELKNLLEKLFAAEPGIQEYIIDRTIKTLSKNRSYYVLRLAEILDINIDPYILQPLPLFSQQQINQILSNKNNSPAALLRETATALEKQGDYQSALLVIEQALKLYPKGPLILAIQKRLKNKLRQ